MPISSSDIDYAAVVGLHATYAATLDLADATALAACFAEDAALLVGGIEVCRGGEEIAERLTSRSDPAVLHLTFPPAVVGKHGERLLTRSYFQLVETTEGRMTGIGTYDDEMARSRDAGWVFAVRSVTYSWKAGTTR